MRQRRRTDYIVVHCSATKVSSDIGVDEIRDWHTRKGWSDIGYHAVIRRNGVVEFGRHFDQPGAHVAGQNYRSVGICLVGGLDERGKPEDNFSASQKNALRQLIAVLSYAYTGAEILGHRDLSPDLDGDGIISRNEWVKDCPCFDVRSWLRHA